MCVYLEVMEGVIDGRDIFGIVDIDILIVIVVFGLKMFELVVEKCCGVYFYFVLFDYIVMVREVMGFDVWFCVE